LQGGVNRLAFGCSGVLDRCVDLKGSLEKCAQLSMANCGVVYGREEEKPVRGFKAAVAHATVSVAQVN
jgi:hypothetical protein